MAVSFEVDTYRLLNAWQQNMQESIWRFNQVAGIGAPVKNCPVYIQADREEIAYSLVEAYQDFIAYLGYFPAPRWYSETIQLGQGRPWQWQQLRTRYGHLIEFGQRATAVIQANASVVYSDTTGNGVDDTATITVLNVTADVDEIQVFFRTADGALIATDERFQIEPVRVTKSGTTVTISGPRALFVSPNQWRIEYDPQDPNYEIRNVVDSADNTGFVSAVDVYRVYSDTTAALTINRDGYYASTSCDGCTTDTADGCGRILDAELGIFQLRLLASQCGFHWPESVTVHYKSGLALDSNGNMDRQLQRALVRLANTKMPRKQCSFCPATDASWVIDRLSPGEQNNGITAAVSRTEAENPFGMLYGAVQAWRTLKRRAIVQAGTLM